MPAPSAPKMPPRFVPTLTEVVEDAAPVWAESTPSPSSPAVPVLKERVFSAVDHLAAHQVTLLATGLPTPIADAETALEVHTAPIPECEPADSGLSKDFEELLVRRVMQRVNVLLDTRLTSTIAAVVQEQTDFIGVRLREEIEAMVRHMVCEALADELAAVLEAPRV